MASQETLPTKGERLVVLVDEALDDLLVVSVIVRGRHLSGVIFDTEKRLVTNFYPNSLSRTCCGSSGIIFALARMCYFPLSRGNVTFSLFLAADELI